MHLPLHGLRLWKFLTCFCPCKNTVFMIRTFANLTMKKDAMLWDTARMIDHNRLALLRLVEGLFVMAGIEPGTGFVEVLPRIVRSAILKVLRQAESATRRLIFAKVRGMERPEYEPRAARSKSSQKRSRETTGERKKGATRIPQFQLIDPRVFMEELYPNRRLRQTRSRKKKNAEPQLLFRIAGIDGEPDYEAWSEPAPQLSPDDLLTGIHICRRLQALYHALNDLPKQAERLLREMARRAEAPPGPGRVPPLRRGTPPGHRKRPIHPVDEILSDCHILATTEPKPPDRR